MKKPLKVARIAARRAPSAVVTLTFGLAQFRQV
jgi:hypothetical protein